MPSRIEKTGSLLEVDAAPHVGGLTVYGQTRQNLWSNPSGTSAGITVTSNEDGTIGISGTATSRAQVNSSIYHLVPGKTYTIDKGAVPDVYKVLVQSYTSDGSFIKNEISATSTETVVSFTLSENAARVNLGISVSSGQTVDVVGLRVMLNEGSAAEPWCPPGLNSVKELSIVMSGKNFLTTGTALPYAMNGVTFSDNGDGGIRVEGTATGVAYYNFFILSKEAPFLQAGEYIASGAIESINKVALHITLYDYDINGTWYNVGKTAENNFAFTLDRAQYLRAFLSVNNGVEVDTVVYPQVERGTVATDYEPPNSTKTEIDLQGNALCYLPDGTRDELRVNEAAAVTLVQRVGYVASYTNQMLGDDIIASAYDEYGLPAQGATVIWRLASEQEIDLGTIDPIKLRKGYNAIFCATDSVITPEMSLSYFKREINGDGISIGSVHSYYDLGQCIASRNTGSPEKKSSTKTVPYMSGFYDFSDLYGGIAYESRELSYSFELLGDSREDLQRQKSELMEWLSYVHDTEIRDDDIPGWHFIGSFSGYSWDETADGESGTLEVTFLCQPFMEADEETSKALAIGTHTVTNDGQPVNPVVSVASGTAKITINGFVQSVTGETRLSVQLPHGDTSVKVEGAAATLKWKEARI